MKQAVIITGGKQHLVAEGQKVIVDKLPGDVGTEISFAEVLLMQAEEKITIGAPLVEGASVKGTIVRHARHPKVWGVKMKPKKRHRRLFGHKQPYTEITITEISGK